jgi:hypothetical protein
MRVESEPHERVLDIESKCQVEMTLSNTVGLGTHRARILCAVVLDVCLTGTYS